MHGVSVSCGGFMVSWIVPAGWHVKKFLGKGASEGKGKTVRLIFAGKSSIPAHPPP